MSQVSVQKNGFHQSIAMVHQAGNLMFSLQDLSRSMFYQVCRCSCTVPLKPDHSNCCTRTQHTHDQAYITHTYPAQMCHKHHTLHSDTPRARHTTPAHPHSPTGTHRAHTRQSRHTAHGTIASYVVPLSFVFSLRLSTCLLW